MTLLKQANKYFSQGSYRKALSCYQECLKKTPTLAKTIELNINLCKKKLIKESLGVVTDSIVFLKNNATEIKKNNNIEVDEIYNIQLSINSLIDNIIFALDNYENKKYFNETAYLALNPDINNAVNIGKLPNGIFHYESFGKNENRLHSIEHLMLTLRSEVRSYNKKVSDLKNTTELKKINKKSINARPIPKKSFCDIDADFSEIKVGVHFHLYHLDVSKQYLLKLQNLTTQFDLYISTPHDSELINNLVNTYNLNVGKLIIINVPNIGRDIAPLVICFGKELYRYDAILHIHTKKTEYINGNNWGESIINDLLGSKFIVRNIINRLKNKVPIIYPDNYNIHNRDPKGWGDNKTLAEKITKDFFNTVETLPDAIDFPEGNMFWADPKAISKFLLLPLKWTDFDNEPILNDGTFVHALERLIPCFLDKNYKSPERIKNFDSFNDYRFYENQEDFSQRIKLDVRILAYYLPQFHAIPENDEWHGKNFTEWVKVKSSIPLFNGHYQQHIPHDDIGYYLLDNKAIFKKQENMLKKSGVYGLIFYHYWFSGRMILEGPAKYLLENKDIDIKFCFCWANENWTRSWDGNANDVLLHQEYSENDARLFMEYLIPFFKDSRYIKTKGRPILYIYRPSSIDNAHEYIKIWNEVCAYHSVPAPYLVACLTRDAVSPQSYGMDAAAERILHDWGSGNIKDIKNELDIYDEFNGSILSYDDVSTYYQDKSHAIKDFPFQRGIIPMWDNTARYKNEAFIVHDSSPAKFQNWLSDLIDQTLSNNLIDEKIITVNAWNEWAEGAHLEPDLRHGYAYLNCIGRALAGEPYLTTINRKTSAHTNKRVKIVIPSNVQNKLNSNDFASKKFYSCIRLNLEYSQHDLFIVDENNKPLHNIKQNLNNLELFDYTLQIRDPIIFPRKFIQNIIDFSISNSDSIVSCNTFFNYNYSPQIYPNGSSDLKDSYYQSVVVIPKSGFRRHLVSTLDVAFPLDTSCGKEYQKLEVSILIRFHRDSPLLELLQNLGSIFAVVGCTVRPIILAQDHDDNSLQMITKAFDDYEWGKDSWPSLKTYYSIDGNGDLRSKILNEALINCSTVYAAVLDYDDRIYSGSYYYLLDRLNTTGKAISFGRVYVTNFDSRNLIIINKNDSFTYGYSYEEFVRHNHAPIHSFILDLSKIDLNNIIYYDDHKYMEDYFLTLQIFSEENADWESLSIGRYIGEYFHAVDRTHTLALTNANKLIVTAEEEYQRCQNRIDEMREKIRSTKS